MVHSQHAFCVPVGDILQDSSRKDTIEFRKKFSTFLPQLVDSAISLDIVVQGMDRSSVFMSFSNWSTIMIHECDLCGTSFSHTVTYPEKELTCLFEVCPEEYKKEDTLYIPPQQTTIDLEGYITETIQLETPIQYVCTTCKELPEDQSSKN